MPTSTPQESLRRSIGSASAATPTPRISDPVNVKWFGAKGDGATNDSAAIQAAIDSLGSTGGSIFFPPGVYLCNISVVANNITFIGNVGRVEILQVCLRPFSAASATVTIGDGVILVYNQALRGISISGTTLAGAAAIAALRYKSAINCFASDILLCGGQKTVHFEGSATQPVTCIYFSNFHIRADYANAAARGIYVKRAAGSYTTGITFTGGHLNGQDLYGYLAETDGEIVYFVNTYMDIFPGYGLKIAAAGGGFHGFNAILDCPPGVAVEVSENVRNISRYLSGYWRADVASIKYLDATTALLAYIGYADTFYCRELKAVGDVALDAGLTVGTTLGVTGLSTLGSAKVGGGTVLTKIFSATAPLDFGLIAAQASAILTIACVGVAVGDVVFVSIVDAVGPYTWAALTAWVSAADVVSVQLGNISAAGVDPASQNYRVVCMRF